MVYAAGIGYLLLTMLLYAPGILIYRAVQKEANAKKVFTKPEVAVAVAVVILACVAIFELVNGNISI